jgi:hypothetical protein
MDECKEYFLRQKSRFMKTYEQQSVNWNENISPCFYEKEWYEQTTIPADMESQWKTRMLMESTPQGTIVMYYDIFKNAFTFYSDLTRPDYFLNGIAMKYVVVFRCRDFYVDERTNPNSSPLVSFLVPSTELSSVARDNKKILAKMAKRPILCKNNFIRLGRLADAPLLQRPKKIPIHHSILFADKKTGYDYMFSGEHQVQQDVMTYAEFKKGNLRR